MAWPGLGAGLDTARAVRMLRLDPLCSMGVPMDPRTVDLPMTLGPWRRVGVGFAEIGSPAED